MWFLPTDRHWRDVGDRWPQLWRRAPILHCESRPGVNIINYKDYHFENSQLWTSPWCKPPQQSLSAHFFNSLPGSHLSHPSPQHLLHRQPERWACRVLQVRCPPYQTNLKRHPFPTGARIRRQAQGRRPTSPQLSLRRPTPGEPSPALTSLPWKPSSGFFC